MSGGVPELACRKRLRSCDVNVKKKEEGRKKMHSEEEEEEERMEMNYMKVFAANSEKKRREMPTNLSDEEEEEETWDTDKTAKKMVHSGHGKATDRKASMATFEKVKKKKLVSSDGGEKKMQSGDRDRDKRKNMLFPFNKNKDPLKEKNWKMPSRHSSDKKMGSGDHHKDKMRNRPQPLEKSKHSEKEKMKILSSHNGEKKNMWGHDHEKDKRGSTPLQCSKNEMKKRIMQNTCDAKEKKTWPSDRMKKKKNASLVLSKENKIQTLTNNKRKNTNLTVSNKEKKMRTDVKDNKEESDGRWKGHNEVPKVQSGDKEKKRNLPAFFKFIRNNFQEFLLLPPMIAPKLKDLTNRRVYLKDSEGKSSKIRLSVVEGSLAFYQGWKEFISDHSIKSGDFLLFEYIGKSTFSGMSTFSVRVFGIDSCERLSFNVERQGGKKEQKESHAPDDLVPCHGVRNSEDMNGHLYDSGEYLGSKGTKSKPNGYMNNHEIASCNLVFKSMNAASGTSHMAADSKEDLSRAVSGFECGPLVALDNKDGYLANGENKAKNIYPIFSKGKSKHDVIEITDEPPVAQETEDAAKLTTLDTASEMHDVTAITKLRRNEIISVNDAAPLAQEQADAVELKTFCCHIEDSSMKKESGLKVTTATKCPEMHDSDEGLRRKQEGNAVKLKCTTDLDNPNNGKMHIIGNVCNNYEAPGGSQCLEKSKKAIVSGHGDLDSSELIRPENRLKTEKKPVVNCSAIRLNPADESYLQPMAGTTFQLQTERGQPEPDINIVSRQRNNIPVRANHVVACQSEHNFLRQGDMKSSSHVIPVPLLPVKSEVLESDDHSRLKTGMQFCIPSTSQTWLELPNPLSNAVWQKQRQNRSVIMLKDPMKRLWPVFYHENSLFVGFTRGWESIVAANNLQTGDVCTLLKDLDEVEHVYHVEITRK
ncbi:B3 domain-containing protein Os02g0598200 isoform X1 [Brachypodium distachyon]|uniref:TF-B3 domain-containing protein n=1 Tax=Brachypodium distachyon TaxID=15368 RepID=I1IB86_BRADI|nr:B3 domain-containing protein Os02g0598200 isoform X1 [Brachypodium distachyon]XP_014755477.1 B3 domain-containing protein Os02g0598200 isoform X1 [Brachypodium distachyon]KQK00185.1 hypothetical protein BRADI_3g47847v3 [Brachypodium distachyon]KQK00186.1 hypothetical protein BRADI_3g47847v3 [Brachypodium distachyon]|eukprot:XP_003575292.2 B3 domain-containing protein Os02g0598200 isoform X1 [Brachypodium distachyon]